VYAFPAAISVGLLALETIYLAVKLPETKNYKASVKMEEKAVGERTLGKESIEVRRNRCAPPPLISPKQSTNTFS
jgi:hypothetical protein